MQMPGVLSITCLDILEVSIPIKQNLAQRGQKMGEKCNTFNSQDSLVVTHPTTNWPLDSFSVMSGRGSEFSELV